MRNLKSYIQKRDQKLNKCNKCSMLVNNNKNKCQHCLITLIIKLKLSIFCVYTYYEIGKINIK